MTPHFSHHGASCQLLTANCSMLVMGEGEGDRVRSGPGDVQGQPCSTLALVEFDASLRIARRAGNERYIRFCR